MTTKDAEFSKLVKQVSGIIQQLNTLADANGELDEERQDVVDNIVKALEQCGLLDVAPKEVSG